MEGLLETELKGWLQNDARLSPGLHLDDPKRIDAIAQHWLDAAAGLTRSAGDNTEAQQIAFQWRSFGRLMEAIACVATLAAPKI